MSVSAAAIADPSRRNVLLLALCQALGQTGGSIIATVAALVGYSLADDKSLSTLPVALQFTAAMVSTIPASLLMRRIGRRAGFSVGAVVGAAGAGLAAYAIFAASFPLFVLASLPLGIWQAFIHYFRFAAADTADERFRPRAISLVMAGGVAAAILGPELAKWSRELFDPVLFAGCFVVMVGLSLASLALLQGLRIPRPPAAGPAGSGRPLGLIVRQPKFIVAVLAAAFGYGTMALIMTATPLAMVDCGFAFDDAAFVIQWHALAMFAPSFVTGHLINRFGTLRIITVGGLLNLAAVAVALSGVTYLQFWISLVLLGLGWNFMFVGGTSLLAETHTPAERAKVQGLNDFLVLSTVALAAFSSGSLHSGLGWSAVALGPVPLLAAALGAVLWLVRRRPLPA